MTLDFEPAQYTRIPNLDVASLIALARQIITAAPKRLSTLMKASLRELGEATAALEATYREHLSVPESTDSRPIDQAADTVWGAICDRLGHYAALPVVRHPQAPRAAELRSQLFPTGLSFTKLEYGAQWAESEQRIQLIRKQRLTPELTEMVGPELMSELAYCHKEYGEMVGVLKAKRARQKLPDLRPLRLRAQQALAAHTIQLLAAYVGGDEKAQEAIQPSFAAIDAYRDKATVDRSKSPAPDPAPAPTV